jgi:thiamine-phosphate pyrophosphorylase
LKKNNKYYRLIDVNLNRAREGLRVIEDTVRFVSPERSGKSEKMFLAVRNLRHKLSRVSAGIYPDLITRRDVMTDAGRVVKETGRKNLAGLVIANFRRVQEAVRVLEEYTKLVSAPVARKLKSVRYAAYDLEKKYHELD